MGVRVAACIQNRKKPCTFQCHHLSWRWKWPRGWEVEAGVRMTNPQSGSGSTSTSWFWCHFFIICLFIHVQWENICLLRIKNTLKHNYTKFVFFGVGCRHLIKQRIKQLTEIWWNQNFSTWMRLLSWRQLVCYKEVAPLSLNKLTKCLKRVPKVFGHLVPLRCDAQGTAFTHMLHVLCSIQLATGCLSKITFR